MSIRGWTLAKRVIRIVRGHNYAFEVVEQNLALGRIRLLGGDYKLHSPLGGLHPSRAGNSLRESELS